VRLPMNLPLSMEDSILLMPPLHENLRSEKVT
jgi:hypothetical protein